MIINFREHKFRQEGKYNCKCGYKFKRVETDCWTENPYNKTWIEQGEEVSNQQCRDEMKKRLAIKKCPKCDKECKRLED